MFAEVVMAPSVVFFVGIILLPGFVPGAGADVRPENKWRIQCSESANERLA